MPEYLQSRKVKFSVPILLAAFSMSGPAALHNWGIQRN